MMHSNLLSRLFLYFFFGVITIFWLIFFLLLFFPRCRTAALQYEFIYLFIFRLYLFFFLFSLIRFFAIESMCGWVSAFVSNREHAARETVCNCRFASSFE